MDLHRSFGGSNGEAVMVLKGIHLGVKPGEFLAVVGQSGSGKSTLLNLLGALDRPSAGKVLIEGEDISRLDDDQLATLRGERIGFIFQSHYLLDEFTCLENALMPILVRRGDPLPEEEKRVRGLLDRVGLSHRLKHRPPQLSGGECQRVAIVRALANQPHLLLADEPTGNLDTTNSREVFALLRQMNQSTGAALVMVTHDERLARTADRIVRIEDGVLMEGALPPEGSPQPVS